MNSFKNLFYFTFFTPFLYYLLMGLSDCNKPLKEYMSLFEKEYAMHWACSGVLINDPGEYYLSYGFNVEHFPENKVEAFTTWYRVISEILMFIPNIEPKIALLDPKLDAPKQHFYLTFHYPDFTLAFHPDLGQISCSDARLNITYFKVNEEKLEVYWDEKEYNYHDFIKSIGFDKNTPFKLSDLEGHIADIKP